MKEANIFSEIWEAAGGLEERSKPKKKKKREEDTGCRGTSLYRDKGNSQHDVKGQTQEDNPVGSFSSVPFSRSVVSNSLRPHESQHARPPHPSPTPGVHSDSHPLSQ